MSRPFSRHYWDLVDDERFDEIYPDDHHYATWSRLLMLADQAWPASGHLPATARKASVTKLAAKGLIELLSGGRFRVTGLDKGRAERAEHAQAAADARWSSRNAQSIAPGDARAMHEQKPLYAKQAEPAEPVEQRQASAPADAWDAFLQRTGEVPGEKIRSWLDELAEAHSEVRVVAMLGALPKTHRTSVDYLKAVRDALRAEDFTAEKAERQDEKRRLEAKRAPLKVLPPATDISPEEARRQAEEYMAAARAER